MAQGNEWAANNKHRVAKKMAPEELAEAEKLAREWKPGDCPAEDCSAKFTK